MGTIPPDTTTAASNDGSKLPIVEYIHKSLLKLYFMIFNRRKRVKTPRIKLRRVTATDQTGMATGHNLLSQTYRVNLTEFVKLMPMNLEPAFERWLNGDDDKMFGTAVIKVFDACYFPEGYLVPRLSDEFQQKELSTYRLLSDLQGSSVPWLVGWGFLEDRELDVQGPFILMEDVGSGHPDLSNWYDYNEVKNTLFKLHQHGVAHCDVRAENMGRRPDGTVVLWDFANSVDLKRCDFSYQAKKRDLKRLHRLSVASAISVVSSRSNRHSIASAISNFSSNTTTAVAVPAVPELPPKLLEMLNNSPSGSELTNSSNGSKWH